LNSTSTSITPTEKLLRELYICNDFVVDESCKNKNGAFNVDDLIKVIRECGAESLFLIQMIIINFGNQTLWNCKFLHASI